MFVTIDSNVLSLPELIAAKLPQSALRWCTNLNRCDEPVSNNHQQMFFNTPVSMSSDVTYYKMPKNAVHFVYLDYGTNTPTLKRILENIKHLDNVIVLSNGDVYSTGQYVLQIGNCTDDDIADVISGIIILHLKENRTVDEREIISLLCGQKQITTNDVGRDIASKNENQKIYSIYRVLDSKRSNYGEIPNCYECKK